MKFDKAQIFVLVVGIAILLGWDPVCKYMGWFQVPVNTPQQPAAPAAAVTPPAASAVQSKTAAVPAKTAPASVKKIRIIRIATVTKVRRSDNKIKRMILYIFFQKGKDMSL